MRATNKGSTIALNRDTQTETNSKLLEAERNDDAINFTKIGEVAAAGQSNSLRGYVFTDNRPESGKNYYRLKQVDKDAAFGYFSKLLLSPVRKLFRFVLILPKTIFLSGSQLKTGK